MPGRAARDECAAPTVGATRGASAVAMAVETCLLLCLLNLLNVNVNVSLFSRSLGRRGNWRHRTR